MTGSHKLLSDSTIAAMVLVVCFAFNMAGRGMADTYVAFLLPLEHEFGWSRTSVASVYSIYMLANGMSAPFVGIIFDRFGPRAVYTFGLLVMGSAYYAAGSLQTLWHLYICIGLASGIGISAMGMVPATSLLSRWFITRTSTAIGLAYAGFGAGSLVIVPFAQYLIDAQGWRATYQSLGVILLVAMPIVLLLPWRRINAGPTQAHVVHKSTLKTNMSLAPLRDAIKTRAFWSLAQAFFFTAFSTYLIMVQTIVFLIDAGFSALEAATAFGFAGMLSVLGVSSAGWLADRYGSRQIVTASFAFTLVGIALLFVLSYYPLQLVLVCYVVVFGISQGARGPIISTISARVFPGRSQATIYGTIYACMSMGAGLGAYMSGLLYDLSGSYRLGFVSAMLAVLLAVSPFWTSKAIASSPHPGAEKQH